MTQDEKLDLILQKLGEIQSQLPQVQQNTFTATFFPHGQCLNGSHAFTEDFSSTAKRMICLSCGLTIPYHQATLTTPI